nr:hypothetical protein CFP56_48679 [Quercus suber]
MADPSPREQQNPETCKDCDVPPTETAIGSNATSNSQISDVPLTVNHSSDLKLPRVAITFCTQCKWMLRAAYFGQELLSTFGSAIGEIALIPATGGLFQVNVTHRVTTDVDGNGQASVKEVLLWDRKAKGGFPETKVLKQLVRDVIEPGKGLGHSDVGGKAKGGEVREDGTTAVQDPLMDIANSGAETAGADTGSDVNSGAVKRPAAAASIDPLLEDANAAHSILDASAATAHLSGLSIATPAQGTTIDPLTEMALTSPISEVEHRGEVREDDKGSESQPMSSFAQDAYATANVPMTWMHKGSQP